MTQQKKYLRAILFTLFIVLTPSSLFASELLCYYGDTQGKPVKINAGYNVAGHVVHRTATALFSKSFYLPDHDSYDNLLKICQNLNPNTPVGGMRIGLSLDRTATIFWPAADAQTNALPFSRIISLGDSLSDNTNTLRYMAEMHKTIPGGIYWVWHFSNGPVWVDYLSQALHIPNTNLAYGGATTFNDGSSFGLFNGILPSMSEQVDFLSEFSKKDTAIKASIPTTLFTIFIGGNDFFFTDHTADEMAAQLDKALNHLYDLGARYFLTIDLPDLSALPHYNNLTEEEKNALDAKVSDYNQKIFVIIDEFKNKADTHIYSYDVNDDFHQILNNQKAGFPKLTPTNCIDVFNQQPNEESHVCQNPETHVFWDEVHPATTMHCLMGNLAAQQIDPDYTFDPKKCVSTMIEG